MSDLDIDHRIACRVAAAHWRWLQSAFPRVPAWWLRMTAMEAIGETWTVATTVDDVLIAYERAWLALADDVRAP